MKKKVIVGILIGAGGTALLVVGWLALCGYLWSWGPFNDLAFNKQEKDIISKYDSSARQNEIVFYGASNFTLWKEMDNDLAEYKVQNHAFGGSTDKDLVKRADKLLYPYDPSIVYFQTGSNDYVETSGNEKQKISKCLEYKEYMFELFHERLPNAKFVVMSGLLLPGRSQYTHMTKIINESLKEMCDEKEYMYFVDAEGMTYDGENYHMDLFIKDGVHLNREGQLTWCDNYIRPSIEYMVNKYSLTNVRN